MNEKLATSVGAAARAARERMELTQVEVAKLVDLHELVYSRMERGRLLPSLTTLLRLCKTLRATPDELLGYARAGKDAPEKDPPDVRRLLNLARRLPPEKLKALVAMASALLD
jgi:transcriptional regulator with XRE-family HTH domain